MVAEDTNLLGQRKDLGTHGINNSQRDSGGFCLFGFGVFFAPTG